MRVKLEREVRAVRAAVFRRVIGATEERFGQLALLEIVIRRRFLHKIARFRVHLVRRILARFRDNRAIERLADKLVGASKVSNANALRDSNERIHEPLLTPRHIGFFRLNAKPRAERQALVRPVKRLKRKPRPDGVSVFRFFRVFNLDERHFVPTRAQGVCRRLRKVNRCRIDVIKFNRHNKTPFK